MVRQRSAKPLSPVQIRLPPPCICGSSSILRTGSFPEQGIGASPIFRSISNIILCGSSSTLRTGSFPEQGIGVNPIFRSISNIILCGSSSTLRTGSFPEQGIGANPIFRSNYYFQVGSFLFITLSRCGGIGRRAGLKIPFL